MRVYKLANPSSRKHVDLRDYQQLITTIVLQEAPNVVVVVEHDYYTIEGNFSKGQAIRVGRNIAKSPLGEFCILRPTLFVGHDESSKERRELHEQSSTKKIHGGRPR